MKKRGKRGGGGVKALRSEAIKPGRRGLPEVASPAQLPSGEDAEVGRLTRELKEALEGQAATAGVLKAISRSTFDLQAVLDTLTASAAQLCAANRGAIWQSDGELLRLTASYGVAPEGVRYAIENPIKNGRSTAMARAAIEGKAVHIPDVLADPEYTATGLREAAQYRTALGVPLIHDGVVIGAFALTREEVNPFTDKQIDLVTTFAAQAVIAIENARLFNEVQSKTLDLEEALAQQAATSEILRVISQSPTDARPVFDSIVKAAVRSLRCDFALVFLLDGDAYVHASGATPEGLMAELPGRTPYDPTANFPSRAMSAGTTLYLPDWSQIELPEHERNMRAAFNVNACLYLPLMRVTECIGLIAAGSHRPNAFGPGDIAQGESFRDQAMIAIENARLFEEVQAKTRDLEESLIQQTATADVLKVISRSAFDLPAVLDTLMRSAAELCGVESGGLTVREGDVFRYTALYGLSDDYMTVLRSRPIRPGRDTLAGRVTGGEGRPGRRSRHRS